MAAVAVASWGVALVGRSVTDERPAPLQAAQVAERLDEASATSSTSSTSSTSTTTVPGPSSIPTTTAGPSPTTTAPASPRPSPTTTAAAPAPGPTAAPPPTTAAGETRTYSLVGGTASLRFSPSGVTVVFANPAQGFDVDIEPEHDNGVRVRFESESHESRLDGWWQDGPQARTEERAGDDD